MEGPGGGRGITPGAEDRRAFVAVGGGRRVRIGGKTVEGKAAGGSGRLPPGIVLRACGGMRKAKKRRGREVPGERARDPGGTAKAAVQ